MLKIRYCLFVTFLIYCTSTISIAQDVAPIWMAQNKNPKYKKKRYLEYNRKAKMVCPTQYCLNPESFPEGYPGYECVCPEEKLRNGNSDDQNVQTTIDKPKLSRYERGEQGRAWQKIFKAINTTCIPLPKGKKCYVGWEKRGRKYACCSVISELLTSGK